MPIEIRELIIKTTVEESSGRSSEGMNTTSDKELDNLKSELMKACKSYVDSKFRGQKMR